MILALLVCKTIMQLMKVLQAKGKCNLGQRIFREIWSFDSGGSQELIIRFHFSGALLNAIDRSVTHLINQG